MSEKCKDVLRKILLFLEHKNAQHLGPNMGLPCHGLKVQHCSPIILSAIYELTHEVYKMILTIDVPSNDMCPDIKLPLFLLPSVA